MATIIAKAGNTWTIRTEAGDEHLIDVNDKTRFVEALGEAGEGARVWVLAQVRPNGNLLALTIMVRERHREEGEPVHFSGEIEIWPEEGLEGTWHENLEGTWKVVGYDEFLVTDRTIILPDGVAPEEGDWARVNAFRQSDGSLWAKKVTILKTSAAEIVVTFTGIIQEYPLGPPLGPPYIGDWLISDIAVASDESTQVIGTPGEGLLAKVKAVQQPNGDLIATKIQVINAPPTTIKFGGVIHAFPPELYREGWVIGVVDVVADGDTEIVGTPEIGLMAKVEGVPQTDGTVLATVITIQENPPGPEEVEFEGIIESLPKHWQHGRWIVSEGDLEWTVLVSTQTVVDGTPAEGKTVTVRGTQTDGVVHASEIVVQ